MAFPLRAADLLALPARPTPVVKPAIPAAVDWFDPSDVRLLDGEFRNAMAKDVEYLIRLDPRRLLAWFQKYVGQFEGSDVFLGWERRGLGAAGAQWIAGHYLSVCAEMYRSTGDRRLLERVNYIVDELAKCQQTAGNAGLVTAERESKAWTEIAAGNVRRSGHLLNDSFVPWYGIHKVFAGLFDAYDFCGNAKAWQVLLRLTAYAPLLARYNFTQWKAANLIWFDADSLVLTPNYHVQHLFNTHLGDRNLPATIAFAAPPPAGVAAPVLGVSAARLDRDGTIILKIANPMENAVQARIVLDGVASPLRGQRALLVGPREAVNDSGNRTRLVPAVTPIEVPPSFAQEVPAMSVQVLTLTPVKS